MLVFSVKWKVCSAYGINSLVGKPLLGYLDT